MTDPLPQASSSISAYRLHSYARRLSQRLFWVHALRGICLSAGVAALTVLLAAAVAEPVLTRTSAIVTWCLVALAGLAALAWALSPVWRYRGTRIADVVAGADRTLSHRLRSALELADMPSSTPGATSAGVSPDLLSAHLADVQRDLEGLPAKRVVPWSRVSHGTLWAGILGVLGFVWLSTHYSGLQSFVSALVAPAQERSDGTRVAPVVAQLRARLTFPSYLGRAPSWLEQPKELSAPAGSTLELQVTPRFAVDQGRVVAGPRSVALQVGNDGLLTGQLSLHADVELHIELTKHGVRYEDPRAIQVHVTPDAIPTVRIETPRAGTLAPPGEVISLRYTASDDVGLGAVYLHARVEGGPERQRSLFSAIDEGGPQRSLESGAEITPEELGAHEGDTLVLWLEARDTDLVTGPHVARSQEVALEVAQPGQGLSEFIPSLQQTADTAVDVLALRLEVPVAKESGDARQRFDVLQRAGRAWLNQIESLLRRTETVRAAPLDSDQLRGVRRRNDQLLTSESALHGPSPHGYAERADVDNRQVDELERDVVLLADMLARAHVDEAKAIAEELRGLKRHIEELLDKLGKTHSPEAERELMREIAKAQRRLAELSQSLSRMATRVPSEFMNREAMKSEAAESSLANLERAVQEHDLRSAAQHLDSLAKQIDELAAQIGQGGVRLQESRFGPRDQALAQARQKLDLLNSEQNRLAERSGDVMRSALERGQRGNSEARAQALAPRADALGKAAQQLADGSEGSSSFQSAAANRAAERARDARDALKTGDLSQARGMAQSAESSLRETADELESEARMFPGRHGEAAERAGRARQAAADAERLTDDIDRAMPELSEHMSEAERQKLHGDADAQHRTSDAADQLKQNFDKGPDGLPLSPEASETLENARKSMQRAERALERGRPDEANREQQQASDKLRKLSQNLAEQQQRSSGRGGKEGKQSSGNGAQQDSHVHIPGAEEWKSPTEMRRRLLDAMQESGPAGYEAAIKRYYQELMR
ncbi:MAG: hypothetical protein RL701_2899 [Pseudomonadota bacterium]